MSHEEPSIISIFCPLLFPGRRPPLDLLEPGLFGALSALDPVRPLRDQHVVLLALPARVRPPAEALPLRVLPQVHEVQAHPGTACGEMSVEAPARHGDLPKGEL